MASASVLSYRLPSNEYTLDIELIVDSERNFRIAENVPGQVCRYIGQLSSLILEQSEAIDSQRIGPYMEVSQRDLLASLHRMLQLDNPYFINQFDCLDERKDVSLRLLSPGSQSMKRGGILQNFDIHSLQAALMADPCLVPETTFDTLHEEQSNGRRPISDSTIKALCSQLNKEQNPQVIEVIVAALGGIGMPEAQPAIDFLTKNLKRQTAKKPAAWENIPQVKCMAIWTIGRLGSRSTIKKAHDILIACLHD